MHRRPCSILSLKLFVNHFILQYYFTGSGRVFAGPFFDCHVVDIFKKSNEHSSQSVHYILKSIVFWQLHGIMPTTIGHFIVFFILMSIIA